MNVGFIGLGTMGGPMARNLLKKGHRLVVFDVTPAAMRSLVGRGRDAARHAEATSRRQARS